MQCRRPVVMPDTPTQSSTDTAREAIPIEIQTAPNRLAARTQEERLSSAEISVPTNELNHS
jgi:hypothetical protein